MKAGKQMRVAGATLAALRSQWWSADRIRAFQDGALIQIMRYAVTQVPFYQRLGIDADRITSRDDLARFPLIDKRTVQSDPDAFVATGLDRAALEFSRTSGSSGQPMVTYFDDDTWLLTRFALKMRRIVATSGLPLFKRVLIVSEQSPAEISASAASTPSGFGVFFSTRRVSIHTPVEQHLEEIVRFRPHVVYAYPSYLLDLIDLAESRGVRLPPGRALYTSSEVLTAAARQRIESAWQTPLFDVYGSTEFKEVAWQCAAKRYHLNVESVYIEIPTSRTGPVVLSTLRNRAMPLLRFNIGDEARFGESGPCVCGRHSAQMLAFTGREGDVLVLPNRRRLTPYLLTTAIESAESLRQYRIVQTAGDALRVDVVVANPGQSALWADRMRNDLEQMLDDQMQVTIREVTALERDKSGKRSVFKRLVANG